MCQWVWVRVQLRVSVSIPVSAVADLTGNYGNRIVFLNAQDSFLTSISFNLKLQNVSLEPIRLSDKKGTW